MVLLQPYGFEVMICQDNGAALAWLMLWFVLFVENLSGLSWLAWFVPARFDQMSMLAWHRHL